MEDAFESEFSLVAINSSLADYKIAFLLNKYLGLRLKRNPKDIDFTTDGYDALFPLFNFDDFKNDRKFYLVGNSCRSNIHGATSTVGLFAGQEEEKIKILNLLPELKKADYLLKLDADLPMSDAVISQINAIPQIAMAYNVDTSQLKSKKNLIFE